MADNKELLKLVNPPKDKQDLQVKAHQRFLHARRAMPGAGKKTRSAQKILTGAKVTQRELIY